MWELTKELAITKRMHVIDQSWKSHLINRPVCLGACLHVRDKSNLTNDIAHYPKSPFSLFNIKTASLQGEQISRLRIPFHSIFLPCKYHLWKQPLLIRLIFIVFKSVKHMFIFVTQCSSSFNNVLAVLTKLAKEQKNTRKITKLSTRPLRNEIFAPRVGTAQPNYLDAESITTSIIRLTFFAAFHRLHYFR